MGKAGDSDDASVRLILEFCDELARQRNVAKMIPSQLQFEPLRRLPFGRDHDSCIVDERIEASCLIEKAGGFFDGREICKIKRHSRDLCVGSNGPYLRDSLFSVVFRAAPEQGSRPSQSEVSGRMVTEPRVRSCDDNGLACLCWGIRFAICRHGASAAGFLSRNCHGPQWSSYCLSLFSCGDKPVGGLG